MTAVAVNLSVAQCKAREHSEDELQLWEQQQDTFVDDCGSGQSLRSPVQSSRAQRRRAAALGTATRYICR